MTAVEQANAEHETQPGPRGLAVTRSSWRPLLAFGAGVAVEIADDALECALVQVRPGGPELLKRFRIERFAERPASEWGTEFRAAIHGLESAGITVLLPRKDIIVRYVTLPAVPRREVAAALALRLRALHPFSDDDVAWCWAPVKDGALVGLTRLSVLGRYEPLFAEAGIPVASFTFSATAIYAALRLAGEPSEPFLGLAEVGTHLFEAYGEGANGTIYSGQFQGPAARAAAVGTAELRLPANFEPVGLAHLMPRDPKNTGANPIDRPVLYAAAIASACPLLVRPANFLPPERRAGQSKLWLIPTAVLAAILVVCVIGLIAIKPYSAGHYLATLQNAIAQAQPSAQRSAYLDRSIVHARQQIALLDSFRAQSKDEFDVLNELTRILPPPAWAQQVEIFPDYVIIAGQAPQAAPLLRILDSSPLFHNSEFTNSVSRTGNNELFRIKTYRRRK